MSQGNKMKTESCRGVEDSVESNLIKKRGEKYYKRLFFYHCVQIIWNSCVLYFKNGGLRNHLQIRIELVEFVIQKHHSDNGNSNPGCLWTEADPLRLTEGQFSDVIAPTEKKDRRLNL
jgi:hypothetical protein